MPAAAAKTAVAEFTAPEEVEESTSEVVAQETAYVVQPSTKSVRVKGTWTMHFGLDAYDFVDGQRYDLPLDLFEYLKGHGNIYDTM